MAELVVYQESMQPDIEAFFAKCVAALGWAYEPEGRHADIVHIPDVYMRGGRAWCLYEGENLAGMVAVRVFDEARKIAEMKRLYVLPAHQGKGYGGLLFERALAFARENAFSKLYLDSRHDRDASLHLIRKHGFAEREHDHANGFAEMFFELPLSAVANMGEDVVK